MRRVVDTLLFSCYDVFVTHKEGNPWTVRAANSTLICVLMLSGGWCDGGLKTANYPNLQRTEIESYILNAN